MNKTLRIFGQFMDAACVPLMVWSVGMGALLLAYVAITLATH